jgi:hypothetical protein
MANVGLTSANQAYVIPILSADNYATWSMKLELLLIRSEIWDVVDGSNVALAASDVVGWQPRNYVMSTPNQSFCSIAMRSNSFTFSHNL